MLLRGSLDLGELNIGLFLSERYRLASALAAAAASVLEARYVITGRLEALLREVRRLYRLGGGEKLSAFASGQTAWAA